MSDDNFNPQNPQPAPSSPSNGGSRPVPDPTILTTEAMNRRDSNLKELFQKETNALVELLKAEIDGDRKGDALRFSAIEKRFDMIEEWRKEQKVDTKTAVDAALSAAEKGRQEQTVASEKSIIKSETATAEQMKQQYATVNASLKGLSDKFDTVKERVDRFESMDLGAVRYQGQQQVQRQEGLDSRTIIFAIITVLLTLTGMGITITIAVTR